jgi:hypothetical protein
VPIVCINRPNRSKARVFTARDVGRIARYAQEDGAIDVEILARVLVNLNYHEEFCLMVGAMKGLLVLRNRATEAEVSDDLVKALKKVLALLTLLPFLKRFPVFAAAIKILVICIGLAELLRELLSTAIKKLIPLDKLVETFQQVCKAADGAAGENRNGRIILGKTARASQARGAP